MPRTPDMPRRTLGVLVLVLFLLVASPAAAKGPSQVEVRNLKTGTNTMITWVQAELSALMELVEWPSARRKPHLVSSGALTHVATLAWQFEDGQAVWLDRVFSDGNGTTWIARRDHLAGNTFVTWGRVRAAYTFDLLLAQLGEEPETTVAPSSVAPSSVAESSTAAAADFDGSSFGLGAAAAALVALLVGGVGLRLRRR